MVTRYRKERELRITEENAKLEKLLSTIRPSAVRDQIAEWCRTGREA